VILSGDLSVKLDNVEIVRLIVFTHVQTYDFVMCVSFSDLYHFIYTTKKLIGDLFEKKNNKCI